MSVWAKSKKEVGDVVTLRDHVKDLLSAFERLKEKKRIPEDLIESVKYAIILHDLGKVLPSFQVKIFNNEDYKTIYNNEYINIYHSLASLLFINKDELKKFLGDCKKFECVLRAVAYHHWNEYLLKDISKYNNQNFGASLKCKTLLGYKHKDTLIDNLRKELNGLLDIKLIDLDEDMLNELANSKSFTDCVTLPYTEKEIKMDDNQTYKTFVADSEESKEFILISGFLQRCDHYASFCEENKKCKDLKNVEIDNIDIGDIIKNIKDTINRKEGELWQEIKLRDENLKDQDIILIAPTGIGKTEFAFIWSGGEKLIYTLLVDSDIVDILNRARAIFGQEKVGLLYYDKNFHYSKSSKQQQEQAEKQQEDMKTCQVSEVLSYPVIIVPRNKLLYYAYKPPLYERIYATLSYSRLVIDEVQAYNQEDCRIVAELLRDVKRLGGRFLLMTTALPFYLREAIREKVSSFKEINLYEDEKDKYKNLRKHKLKLLKIKNSQYDFTIPNQYIQQIIDKAEKGKRVLVILNTVKRAYEVHRLIEENIDKKKIKLILFHSELSLKDRQEKMKNEIEGLLKNPKVKGGVILVTTSVVEAGMDIDADVLYTEMCPIDALVRRMGRVLRRSEENYPNNAEPNVYVFAYEEVYKSSDSKGYDEELIRKSKNLLEKVLNERDEILLSEYDKYELTNKFYDEIGKEFRKQRFYPSYKTYPPGTYGLSLMTVEDIYYIFGIKSDMKDYTQEVFKRTISIEVVYENRRDDFKKAIRELVDSDSFSYIKFKDRILEKFVIQISLYDLERYGIKDLEELKELSIWLDEVEAEFKAKVEGDDYESIKFVFLKLKEWCEGIFILQRDSGI